MPFYRAQELFLDCAQKIEDIVSGWRSGRSCREFCGEQLGGPRSSPVSASNQIRTFSSFRATRHPRQFPLAQHVMAQ
jgi:hypothetical protein